MPDCRALRLYHVECYTLAKSAHHARAFRRSSADRVLRLTVLNHFSSLKSGWVQGSSGDNGRPCISLSPPTQPFFCPGARARLCAVDSTRSLVASFFSLPLLHHRSNDLMARTHPPQLSITVPGKPSSSTLATPPRRPSPPTQPPFGIISSYSHRVPASTRRRHFAAQYRSKDVARSGSIKRRTSNRKPRSLAKAAQDHYAPPVLPLNTLQAPTTPRNASIATSSPSPSSIRPHARPQARIARSASKTARRQAPLHFLAQAASGALPVPSTPKVISPVAFTQEEPSYDIRVVRAQRSQHKKITQPAHVQDIFSLQTTSASPVVCGTAAIDETKGAASTDTLPLYINREVLPSSERDTEADKRRRLYLCPWEAVSPKAQKGQHNTHGGEKDRIEERKVREQGSSGSTSIQRQWALYALLSLLATLLFVDLIVLNYRSFRPADSE